MLKNIHEKVIIFALAIFAITLAFIIVAWVLWREYPDGAAQFVRWFIIAGIPSLCLKKGIDRWINGGGGESCD